MNFGLWAPDLTIFDLESDSSQKVACICMLPGNIREISGKFPEISGKNPENPENPIFSQVLAMKFLVESEFQGQGPPKPPPGPPKAKKTMG